MAVGNFDLKIPTENIPSVNPLVFSKFLVVLDLHGYRESYNLKHFFCFGFFVKFLNILIKHN